MNSYLKTSYTPPTHRQTQEQTLQSQLDKMVQNTPSINAWSVNFYDGDDSWRSKTFEYYVRCVRGQ